MSSEKSSDENSPSSEPDAEQVSGQRTEYRNEKYAITPLRDRLAAQRQEDRLKRQKTATGCFAAIAGVLASVLGAILLAVLVIVMAVYSFLAGLGTICSNMAH